MFILITELLSEDLVLRVQKKCPVLFSYKKESETTGSLRLKDEITFDELIAWLKKMSTSDSFMEKRVTGEEFADYHKLLCESLRAYSEAYSASSSIPS